MLSGRNSSPTGRNHMASVDFRHLPSALLLERLVRLLVLLGGGLHWVPPATPLFTPPSTPPFALSVTAFVLPPPPPSMSPPTPPSTRTSNVMPPSSPSAAPYGLGIDPLLMVDDYEVRRSRRALRAGLGGPVMWTALYLFHLVLHPCHSLIPSLATRLIRTSWRVTRTTWRVVVAAESTAASAVESCASSTTKRRAERRRQARRQARGTCHVLVSESGAVVHVRALHS